MSQSVVWGYVSADRQLISGSGDFAISAEGEDGVYTIFFDTPFNTPPAVTATVLDSSLGKQTGIHMTVIEAEQISLCINNTGNQARYNMPFCFHAIGLVED